MKKAKFKPGDLIKPNSNTIWSKEFKFGLIIKAIHHPKFRNEWIYEIKPTNKNHTITLDDSQFHKL